jgi:hypothetical protein
VVHLQVQSSSPDSIGNGLPAAFIFLGTSSQSALIISFIGQQRLTLQKDEIVGLQIRPDAVTTIKGFSFVLMLGAWPPDSIKRGPSEEAYDADGR